MEIWKEIPGFPNYEISNKSNVKSIARIKYKIYGGKYNGLVVPQSYPEKILTPRLNNAGYYGVHLYHKGKMQTFSIHRLVALAFLPNPENKQTINHKDGNKQNNDLSNLEWATVLENITHAKKTGLSTYFKGEQCTNSKLSDTDVVAIRALYKCFKISPNTLGRMFCVAASTALNVANRDTWKHII